MEDRARERFLRSSTAQMSFRGRTTQLGAADHPTAPTSSLDAVKLVSSEVRETGIKKDE